VAESTIAEKPRVYCSSSYCAFLESSTLIDDKCDIPSQARDSRRRSARLARLKAHRSRLIAAAAILVAASLTGWLLAADNTQSDPVTPAAPRIAAGPNREMSNPATPTPFFARYGRLHLYLPVDPSALIAIAYHQASGDAAAPITSLLPDADMNLAAANRSSTPPTVATSTTGSAILQGQVLRMWRTNRRGPPDTAVDIGAPPGTPVLAPISGEIVGIRPYKLYNSVEDYEIHIAPTGWPEINVVLIHVDKPTVKVGDRVIGGVTAVAEIRLLSDRIDHQLGGYTRCDGDHVHIQVNLVPESGGLQGVEGGS